MSKRPKLSIFCLIYLSAKGHNYSALIFNILDKIGLYLVTYIEKVLVAKVCNTLTPYWSVLDFWKIEFEKSSWKNLSFCLFQTWFSLPEPSKFKFEIDKKSSSFNLIFQNQVQINWGSDCFMWSRIYLHRYLLPLFSKDIELFFVPSNLMGDQNKLKSIHLFRKLAGQALPWGNL